MFNLLILKRRQSLQEIQDIIDRILAHLCEKEQGRPTRLHLGAHLEYF